MKALKIAGITLAVIALLVLIGIVVLPSTTTMERSVLIERSSSEIYPHLVSFRTFNEWSPWYKMEPNAAYSYSGPESGVGAKMAWVGQDVGSGSQEIVEVKENEWVRYELMFEGFDDPAEAKMLLEPQESGTRLTWTFKSEMNGIYKFFGLMMDKMLGPQYEAGLNDLKVMVESAPSLEPSM